MSSSEIRPRPFDHGLGGRGEALFTAVRKQLEDGVTLVTATGEIDLASAPALAEELSLAGQAPLVLLDLSAVTFMDSSGLRVLLAAHTKAVKSASRLRLYGIRRAVRKPLEITGIAEILDIHETQAAALADVPPR
jgi:anti-sigma B factor antagonist